MNAQAQTVISAGEAAEELLRRRRARKGLIPFTEYTFPRYDCAPHHSEIAAHLELVEQGQIPRLMIIEPPRHGKSELASRRFPAYYIGRNPTHGVVAASYNSDLAMDFGREVRNIVLSPAFQHLFPNSTMAADSRATDRWHTAGGGSYAAAGVGTAVTGRDADLFLIDDPLKDREDANSQRMRDRLWNWYSAVVQSRLPRAIVLIQCMTGDTPVLMGTGQEKPLRDVRAGDVVATYENGEITTSTVTNWIDHGPDLVYQISMSSGRLVKANARHPFLVNHEGSLIWRRVKELKPGDQIQGLAPWVGESGAASRVAAMDAKSRPKLALMASVIARSITPKPGQPRAFVRLLRPIRRLLGLVTSSTVTGLQWLNMIGLLPLRAAGAPSAVGSPKTAPPRRTGSKSFALTIATTAKMFAGFCATNATSWSPRGATLKRLNPPSPISSDTITAVKLVGREDVFDIEVARTENFIANGLISHNTRWHEDDLAGRLLEQMAAGGEHWKVLHHPAINAAGGALWEDKYPLPRLEAVRDTMSPRDWSALFQGEPAPEEGDFFKEAWFQWYDQAPKHLTKYGYSDYAITEKDGDWTVHGVCGIDPNDDLYVLDWARGQWDSMDGVERGLDLMGFHKPLAWGEEGAMIEKTLGPYIKKRQSERKEYVYRVQLPSTGDKMAKAQSFRARAAQGKVYLPRNAPWVPDLLAELLMFPSGKNDDQVDVCGGFGRMIDKMAKAAKPPKPYDPDKPLTLNDAILQDEAYYASQRRAGSRGV